MANGGDRSEICFKKYAMLKCQLMKTYFIEKTNKRKSTNSLAFRPGMTGPLSICVKRVSILIHSVQMR